MRLSRMWTLRGHPGADGLENAETESTLREALAEPAAPGEDDSYRRLMAVIADDMRLREPAPQRSGWNSWGWVPAMSGAATVAILFTLVYMAGVDHGYEFAMNQPKPPSTHKIDKDTVVPRDKYETEAPPIDPPRPAPAERPERPRLAINELPPPSPMNYIGNLLLEGLSREQRDMVRLYQDQAKAEHWANAAGTLEDLAELDLDSETAIKALHGAAVIYQNRLKNDVEALRLYRREAEVLEQQLESAETPERQAAMEKQRELALTSISALSETQGGTQAE